MTQELSDWNQQQEKNAHHRALIRQILHRNPQGLTVQQILAQELDIFGYTFITDNRLREMRDKDEAESFGDKPQKWRLKP